MIIEGLGLNKACLLDTLSEVQGTLEKKQHDGHKSQDTE